MHPGPAQPPASRPARVLVVDDHPLFRRGLHAMLAHQPWVSAVLEAATVAEALRCVVAEDVDVVAMDVRLPDGDGVETTARISRLRPEVAVLLLTMVDDEDLVVRGLRAGARGYLLKESDPDAVVEALHTVLRGGLVLGPRVAASVLATLRTPPRRLPPPFDLLTPREREVVAHLAAGRGNLEIARALGLSDKTVRNTVSAVLAKLQVTDRVQAALLARDAGLVPGPDHRTI
jgi:two-component system, NarL family, nitrate/nitrite response regulator NarL